MLEKLALLGILIYTIHFLLKYIILYYKLHNTQYPQKDGLDMFDKLHHLSEAEVEVTLAEGQEEMTTWS